VTHAPYKADESVGRLGQAPTVQVQDIVFARSSLQFSTQKAGRILPLLRQFQMKLVT
jgi:hypothetical protein